ncbi:MAG TPA: DUF4112 domain-containing protein [Asticcacaulis sp.]
MRARTHEDILKIHDSVDTVKRLSDRIIGIGPINLIGLDGILSWVPVPGLDLAYSVLAGGFILVQGARARCDATTLVAAALVLAVDAGLSLGDTVIPVLGAAADTLFQGQLYAAHMIQRNIDKTHYVEGGEAEARRNGDHARHVADMRAMKGKTRVVYLG